MFGKENTRVDHLHSKYENIKICLLHFERKHKCKNICHYIPNCNKARVHKLIQKTGSTGKLTRGMFGNYRLSTPSTDGLVCPYGSTSSCTHWRPLSAFTEWSPRQINRSCLESDVLQIIQREQTDQPTSRNEVQLWKIKKHCTGYFTETN